MSWVAVAVVGGAALGAYASSEAADAQSKAARSAARTSADAARYQSDVQEQTYDQQRADQTPWRETGANALNQLAMLTGVGGTRSALTGGNYTPAEAVAAIYETHLGRAPDASGLADYMRQYDEGASLSDIERSIASSKEAQDYLASGRSRDPSQTIAGLYQTYLGRAPDAGGLQNYLSLYQQGLGMRDIQSAIASSPEARSALTSGKVKPSASAAGGGGAMASDLLRPFGMSDFQEDPGYAFRQAEGMKAIERSAAARGGLLSGSAMKGIERFGQNLASDEFQNAYNRYNNNQTNAFNRLASLAGVGQTANSALASAGQNYANAMTGISQANAATQGNALMAAGNARASGYAGIGNALSGAFANYSQPQQSGGAVVPAGYQYGSGGLGNAWAIQNGYQPLDHATANAGFYD